MVFLYTDGDEYRELPRDGIIKIGRGVNNHIQPVSQSVSMEHAILILSPSIASNSSNIKSTKGTSPTEKIDVYIEDLNSKNGTLIGPSSSELIRVKGKVKLFHGDLIKFGYSQKFFKFLEKIPLDLENPPELIVASIGNNRKLDNKLSPTKNNFVTAENTFDENDTPLHAKQEKIVQSGFYENHPPISMPVADSSQNMVISINYPTQSLGSQHPVSITIDPQNNRSNRYSDAKLSNSNEIPPIQPQKRNVPMMLNSSSPASLSSLKRVEFEPPHDDEDDESPLQYSPSPIANTKSSSLRNVYPSHSIKTLTSKSNEVKSTMKEIFQDYLNPRADETRSHESMTTIQKNRKMYDIQSDSDLDRINVSSRAATIGNMKSSYEPSKYPAIWRPGVSRPIGQPTDAMDHQEEAAKLIRRSWPNELRPPQSEMIGSFVDLILDQEIGTTSSQFQLVTRKPPDPGEDGDVSLLVLHDPQFDYIPSTKCILPEPISTQLLSECIAQNLLLNIDNHFQANESNPASSPCHIVFGKVIQSLNELLRQFLLGATIHSKTALTNTSMEFDHALNMIFSDNLTFCIESLDGLIQNDTIIQTLHAMNSHSESENNVVDLLTQSIDSLKRLNAFLLGHFLVKESKQLLENQIFEIAALSTSGILDRVDSIHIALWNLFLEANDLSKEHLHSNRHDVVKGLEKKGPLFSQPSNPSKKGGESPVAIELEELRNFKKEMSHQQQQMHSIRKEEATLAASKLNSLLKILKIVKKHQLRTAFHKWHSDHHAKILDDYHQQMTVNRTNQQIKSKIFQSWKTFYQNNRTSQKMKRFWRVLSHLGRHSMVGLYFRHWYRTIMSMDRRKGLTSHDEEIAEYQLEIKNLKSIVHELMHHDDNAAKLMSERVYTKELSAMNMELRSALQRSKDQIIQLNETKSLPQRREWTSQYMMEMEMENESLRRELKKWRDSVQSTSESVPMMTRKENESKSSMKRLDPLPVMKGSSLTKEDAKSIILMEMLRIKKDHQSLIDEKNQLHLQNKSEMDRNVQQSIAMQHLQSKLSELSNSCHGLRDILQKRYGVTEYHKIIDELESRNESTSSLLDIFPQMLATATGHREMKISNGNHLIKELSKDGMNRGRTSNHYENPSYENNREELNGYHPSKHHNRHHEKDPRDATSFRRN